MKNQDFPPEIKIPKHLAIIPDGNRRWAKIRGLPTIIGHQKGFRVLLNWAQSAQNWGVHTVTIWLFSTENWQRSKDEVDYLMKIEEETLKKYLPKAKKEKIRIIHLGRKERIPKSFAQTIAKAENETRKFTNHILNIAIDYGGRDEILRAITKIAREKSQMGNLTEEEFAKYLDTADQPYPYPDLLVRTAGEMRTSGFLPWQITYTEFYFIDKYLPECTIQDLKAAIIDFSKRERRFGR